MVRKKLKIDEATIRYGEKPDLSHPILIEGLPGVGNVGKLAAEHLIDEIGATKFAEIFSTDFPPQVFVDHNGLINLVRNELYYWNTLVSMLIALGMFYRIRTKTKEGQIEKYQMKLDQVNKELNELKARLTKEE